MLRCSFCFLGGLGVDAERRLWRRGIVSWDDYCRSGGGVFNASRHERILADMGQAESALEHNDVRHFLRCLPMSERVRVWPMIQGRTIYLDIETTGLSHEDKVTTVALYDGQRVLTYVRGQSLQALAADVREDAVLVTYNGRQFDLPFLRRELKHSFRQPHLDLCPILRKRGYTGGLKACERRLGVARKEMRDATGAKAPTLWQAYRAGDEAAIGSLLGYNVQDALVLERLLVAAYNESMRECPVHRPIPAPKQSDNLVRVNSAPALASSNYKDHKM